MKTNRILYTFRNILILVSFLTLISCTNIYYENPQPAGQPDLTEFPKKLTGIYLDADNGDTIITIYNDGFVMSLNGNDVKIPLNNKAILRKYKSYYFLSLKSDNENLWTVFIAKPGKKKTMQLYDLTVEDNDLNALNSITEVKLRTRDDDGSITRYINPDLKEFDEIIKAGLLHETRKLKK